jgi:hypothetical protein
MQASNQTNEKADALLKKSFDNAVQMMAKAGYKIPNNVKVTIDPQLPFMGYTMPTRQGFNIVVAGGAVGSAMLEGLLMHEMGHIYRITTNHPSHNAQILEEAIGRLGTNLPDYQQKIIHDLLNDIQDLYADDLTFKALPNSPVIGPDQMTEFLQSWVKDAPVRSENPTHDRWTNTSLMTHNARAIAQMARLRVEDTGGLASKANKAFLDHVDPDIAGEFDYFRKTLLNLREDMTPNDYRKLLAEYLDRFVRITEKG